MNLIFLGLLALAVAKPKGKISFSLIEERSSNGIPSVKVDFADGSSDFLVLSKYENMDGHFIGHLANEKTACVAMVNHPEHAELTIMSDRVVGSTMYKWENNGKVEMIPEVFSNGETDMVMERGAAVSWIDDEDIENQKVEDELLDIEGKMTASEAASVPTMAHLQIQVAYDQSIKEKLGNKAAVIAYWNAGAPHLQARYCHETLGTKIKVERIGNFEYFNQKIVASGEGLNTVQSHAAGIIGTADLVVYMANDESTLWGTIGIAWSPVICGASDAHKTSINEWRPEAVSYGGLLAHEIGHNLGMRHDFDAKHGGDSSACNQDNHIMSYGNSKDKWSTCSKADFEARYLQVKNQWCLEGEIGTACGGAPTPTPPSPIVPGPTPPGPTPSPPCNDKCENAGWKDDKYCDDGNNNCGCEWDGGDCCGPDVKKDYCTKCECLDPTKTTEKPTPPPCNDLCSQSSWKGDGYCDDGNNNCGCEWDGGDCCGSDVNKNYCKECECKQ